MPTRAVMELARPLCHRSYYIRKGQNGHDYRCHGIMDYILIENAWKCRECAYMHDGATIAARHSTILAELAEAA